jgi:hypothetical protein
MRNVTTQVIDALAASMVRPAFFVEAWFTSGPIHVWTGYGSVSWNGQTWLGVGTLGSISTIEEGSDIQARGITLEMSGIDVNLLEGILSEFQVGLPVRVWLGLFDSTMALIPDPLLSFAGRMDQPTLDVGGETASISINCESRLIDMNVACDRRYTDEDQQLDHPGDRGFEFVNSIQEITVTWGRTPSSSNNM